ncbi:MAG: MBOAT family protein [Bacteroidales bacterium]
MLFNNIEFVIFLPVVVIFYYLLPGRYRWILLLAASYFFYMSWKAEYIFLIVGSTLVDYFAGLRMERLPDCKSRRPWLLASLFTNLGLLFTFKYFNFAAGNLNQLFDSLHLSLQLPHSDLLLPVGISFYTFQTLSYSIDVYYGKQKAERHLGYFALYVAYFPQLVAGPIERFSRLSPQLKERHVFTYENLVNGLRLILYGLFIKMVIADNLSGFVDKIYAAPEQYGASDILLGILFYSFQIYSDFYGYSVIAIGSALIMGVRIMDNFRTPYLAKNIAEFWQRWHISLSTWFRDYLYLPLGGNRVSSVRWMVNILAVFVVSGFWHGANWTFLIWGGLYGIVYLIEKATGKLVPLPEQVKPFSPTHLLLAGKTFILVTLIWVFFRSQSLPDALEMFRLAFDWGRQPADSLQISSVTWWMMGLFLTTDIALYNTRFDEWVARRNTLIRWSIYSLIIFCVIVFAGVENFPFIYFQF